MSVIIKSSVDYNGIPHCLHTLSGYPFAGYCNVHDLFSSNNFCAQQPISHCLATARCLFACLPALPCPAWAWRTFDFLLKQFSFVYGLCKCVWVWVCVWGCACVYVHVVADTNQNLNKRKARAAPSSSSARLECLSMRQTNWGCWLTETALTHCHAYLY